jgi:hypothetical protein
VFAYVIEQRIGRERVKKNNCHLLGKCFSLQGLFVLMFQVDAAADVTDDVKEG